MPPTIVEAARLVLIFAKIGDYLSEMLLPHTSFLFSFLFHIAFQLALQKKFKELRKLKVYENLPNVANLGEKQ